METRTTYFDNPGKENTEAVLDIVKRRCQELGIEKVLVASYRGSTGVQAVSALDGMKVIVVGGFRDPNKDNLAHGISPEDTKLIESKGGKVYIATHLFAGINRTMSKKLETAIIGDIIAATLRIIGTGIKVACEITVMAADAGLVGIDEDVIAIGGTRGGADAAAVIRPVNSSDFFDLKVKEILCKPRYN